MEKQKELYLEKKTGATVATEDDCVVFSLHRAKIKLHEELEIHMLKAVDPEIRREFSLTEDVLRITCYPPASYIKFDSVLQKNKQTKWRAAYNLLHLIEQHSQERLKLIICPENVLFDQGMMPHILYYGVKESIPPYENDAEQLWEETKAIVAALADDSYDFASYLAYHKTLKISNTAKQIMQAENYAELDGIIAGNLKQEEDYETTTVHVSKKKWKLSKRIMWGLVVLLVPALIYTVFAVFFKIPETQAYVASNESFLQNRYSEVIDTLEDYDYENMPFVVQYQLATAYLAYENLEETQKKNIENTITLQSDERYFTYWINIGRGDFEKAIEIARSLESRDLIVYGLLKNREAVKADDSLEAKEREDKINEIDQEIEGYQKEMEEEKKAEQELEAQEKQSGLPPEKDEQTKQTIASENEKAEAEKQDKTSDKDTKADNKNTKKDAEADNKATKKDKKADEK